MESHYASMNVTTAAQKVHRPNLISDVLPVWSRDVAGYVCGRTHHLPGYLARGGKGFITEYFQLHLHSLRSAQLFFG